MSPRLVWHFRDLARLFFCTLYFHDESERENTWMADKIQLSAFATTSGYDGEKSADIHIQRSKGMKAWKFLFCYLPDASRGPPSILDIYFFSHSLARIFRENIMSKAGNLSNCHAHHINYCVTITMIIRIRYMWFILSSMI
jgi:hypothetical protein